MAPSVTRFLGYLLRRSGRRADDHQVAAELAAPPLMPDGVQLDWLGTSCFRLSCAGYTLIIDPYVSRAPLRSLLRRRPALPDEQLVRRYIPEASAVLIGHAHFDHIVDAPMVSRLYDAPVYGSRSAARLMQIHGLADHAVEVDPYRRYEVGPFSFSFTPSVHSKLVLGLYVPADGDISCEHFDELNAGAYRCGQVWGIHIEVEGVSIYHQGSADLIDSAVRARNVDLFLCGIAGRAFSKRYMQRVLRALEPRVIIPHHFDDFFRPLSAPLEFSFNVDLAGFPDEVAAVSKEFDVRTLVRVSS